ncbi:hypothetical protein EXIGLDRAFT_733713 [Exidia glandulosa HHB12029]|uniref:MYND-type domain-containing protein n=1 Tax=Exidia glandulosa HHB12029 TaxID=1314781 RepID=A0A165B860_EXIGL|nr:hypothetical protein EXIGLDRAFT_733713 [Exidia glandulosa HHB12029]
MVFITVSRTETSREETRRAIAAALSVCSNPFGRKRQHSHATLALLSGDNLLYMVIGMFLELVDLCLSDSDRRLVHSQRFSSRGLWPCSTEDLLPFGPQQSFLSLVHWLAVRGDILVMIAFEDIFLTCRDELGPVILEDTNRRLFANAISYQMQDALTLLKKERSESRPPGAGNFSPTMRILTLNDILFDILRALSPNQQLRSSTTVLLLQGFEHQLLKGIEEALSFIEVGVERDRLTSVASALHSSLGTPIEDRLGYLRLPFFPMPSQSDSASNLAQRIICDVRMRHDCGARNCTVRERDVGRRLQRCAGCGIVQYCSKDCQRRDWKASETPHKAVCALLKRLAPLLELSEGDFRKRVREINITQDELALMWVNIRHGNVPVPKFCTWTIPEKIQNLALFLRMQDSFLGDEDAPPSLEGLRDAMLQSGIEVPPFKL